jgi:ABC-type branched-subunit amino acid transport system ATPase component
VGADLAPLLETRGLAKEFGGLRALQGIDLSVHEGEILGLIGPNGSGKTTFFNVLTGIHPATGGTIRFAAHPDIARLPPHRITRLGIARTFQNQRLFNQMTVLENVLVGLVCRTRAGLGEIVLNTSRARAEKRQAEERAMECLAIFRDRLVPRRDRPAMSLSYANRRRLEIARALATAPRMLLLDEPAAGMNPTETRELMADIVRIRDMGITILVIEHDMRLVKGVTSRVVALDHGVKIAEGTFAEVREHPAVLEAYLGRRAATAA